MKKAIGILSMMLCLLLACGLAAVFAEDEAPDVSAIPALEPGENTGSLRVLVFNDKNSDGKQGNHEDGVAGITICLMQGDRIVTGAVTGTDGMALMENIPAGTYTTRMYTPEDQACTSFGGDEQLTANAFMPTIAGYCVSNEITISAGRETMQGGAIQQAYSVSGFCWEEAGTADGVYKEGDKPLGGVKLSLDGQKNGLHYETVSNPDGTWKISRVRYASYNLTVYVPEGMMFTRPSEERGIRSVFTSNGASQKSKQINLNDKVNKTNENIGFTRAAEVTGICYIDANYNGYYDEGEQPLAGVKMVALKQQDDETISTAVSGEDGRFTITALRGNVYKIRALLPDDGSTFTVTAEGELGNRFVSRPDRRENFWNDFRLEDGESREIAVGAIYPATVKGTVYMDDDFSATMNGKEKIVSNYLVSLTDENGNVVAADKTSVKGLYELIGVPPGQYRLSVQAVKGYAFTKLGEGNVVLNKTGGEGYSELFTVGIADTITGMDIGMIKPGTVEGEVFADRNDNGIRDDGENGLPGVTVRLVSEDGEEAFRAEIGEDGHYLFDAVMPGHYYVEYLMPDNAVVAKTAENGNRISGEGAVGRTESFGFVTGGYEKAPLCGALALGRIEGAAYQDHNGNGTQDPGEENLAGMTVTLIPSRDDLEEVTAVSGADGTFELTALRPDAYTLRVACPEGFAMSRTDSLELPLTAGKTTQSVELDLPMGAAWTGQMTGAVRPASIRGRVWMDENCNGLFDDGEKTPAGLAVTVVDESTGNVFDTPATDAEGYFTAAGMIPGNFTVFYALDENTIAPTAGDNQFAERDGRLEMTGIRLEEDDTCDSLLLGIVRYTKISGRAWINRGDTTELLGGMTVTLTDENGATVGTAASGEEGEYSFAGLLPGTYVLQATAPEGSVIIEPDDSRLGGGTVSVMTDTVNRNGKSDPIMLHMGEDREGMDIGCVLPGALGDICWLDLNRDGLQGAGEGGIPGVRVEAQRNGFTVAETVTDQYGFWRLPDLYPAVYTLIVTAPSEVKPTVRRTDIPIIASVLEETDGSVCYAYDIAVESDCPNYNADLGFVLRRDDVLPAGYGQGATQIWN